MPTTHAFIPVLGKRIRVTPLGGSGKVEAGAKYIATEGFISTNLTSEVETGTEILVKNASGSLCVNEKRPDSFKRFNVEIEFCGVNPALLSMLTNAEAYADAAGNLAGFTVPEGEIEKQFALELWSGLSGFLGSGTEEASGYFLLPYIAGGTLGDITINGENAITFSLTGAYTKGGNGWGRGPYNVVMEGSGVGGTAPFAAAKIPTAIDPFDHLLLIDTALAPPPSAIEPVAVPTV